jgi:hypothetical protein
MVEVEDNVHMKRKCVSVQRIQSQNIIFSSLVYFMSVFVTFVNHIVKLQCYISGLKVWFLHFCKMLTFCYIWNHNFHILYFNHLKPKLV